MKSPMNSVPMTFTCLLALCLVSLPGSDIQAQKQTLSPAEKNFEFLWQAYDQNYALFKAKSIDWRALYNIYRPMVTAETKDDELWEILSRMLSHLNDNHVRLVSADPERYFGAGWLYDRFGPRGTTTLRATMRRRPVPDRYFREPLQESANKIFTYGWIEEGIGYLHFRGFGDTPGTTQAIDEIIRCFQDAKAILVDVRRNGGGDDRVGKLIADRFADCKRLYMTSRDRNGSRHDDFDPPHHFFVEPGGPRQFTKTVILLTNRLSISAAENFTLAMRILPHVTVVGDFTSGCFADAYDMKLPNGWEFTFSENLFLDHNGFCWEGIGVPPDIKVSCRYDETTEEKDRILETALALVRLAPLRLQDKSEGLRSTESLASMMEKEIATKGIEQALRRFEERRVGPKNGIYYIDYSEMTALARKCSTDHRPEIGGRIFSLIASLFPEDSRIYEDMGMEYLRQDRKEKARQAIKQAALMKRDRLRPPARQFDEYLSDLLILEMISGDSKTFLRRYDTLLEQFPGQVNEALLNELGYRFLRYDRQGDALQVFHWNAEKFPDSANVYDSLGEAYRRGGKRDLAIVNYEKSLRLNPKNTHGAEKLRQLREAMVLP